MITTKEKIDAVGFPEFTLEELRERIAATIEEPPCFIDWNRKNGFAWYERGIFSACIGTAVALYGYDGELTADMVDRKVRAERIGWEWSALMHFEMAINSLFKGDIRAYNFTGYFPKIQKWSYIPPVKSDGKGWHHVYKAML